MKWTKSEEKSELVVDGFDSLESIPLVGINPPQSKIRGDAPGCNQCFTS